MLAPISEVDVSAHVSAWNRASQMMDAHRENLLRIRGQLIRVWPPEGSQASQEFLIKLDQWIASVESTAAACAGNARAVSDLADELMAARRTVRDLRVRVARSRGTPREIAATMLPGYVSVEEQATRQARQAMTRADAAIYDHAQRLSMPDNPKNYHFPGSGVEAPRVGRFHPARGSGESGWSGEAPSPPPGWGGLAGGDAGSAGWPGPVPAGAAAAGSGVAGDAGGWDDPGPVLSGSDSGIPGGVTGGPAGAAGGSGRAGTREDLPGAVSASGAAALGGTLGWAGTRGAGSAGRLPEGITREGGGPVPGGGWDAGDERPGGRPGGVAGDEAGQAPRTGGSGEPGNDPRTRGGSPTGREPVMGLPGVGGRRSGDRSRYRPRSRTSWPVRQGISPVLEPQPQPEPDDFDPGPGVIGLDR